MDAALDLGELLGRHRVDLVEQDDVSERDLLLRLVAVLDAGDEVLGVLALGTVHAANPFDRDTPDPPPAARLGTPGFLAAIGAPIVRLQREASVGLTQALARIRDGASPTTLLVGLSLAFLYGGFHAIGPGHGKAVVASYFLSHDASWLRGFLVGARIAATHVTSAVLVVLVVQLVLDVALTPSFEDMRAVQLVSYGAVIAVGLLLLRSAWRRPTHDHAHAGHDCCNYGHRHDSGGGLMSLVLGMVPCTGAVLILVFTLANAMLATGLLMVLAIALGMALTMGLLGIFAILARQRLQAWARLGAARASRFTRALDLGGPAFIVLFGLGLFAVTL
jgi:nickel/cobalt exporter